MCKSDIFPLSYKYIAHLMRPFSCVGRFPGCVLRGAADRPSEAGVSDQAGLPGDPQRRSKEQRGSGAGEAALNTHSRGHTNTHHQKHDTNTYSGYTEAQKCVGMMAHTAEYTLQSFAKYSLLSKETIADHLESVWQQHRDF